MSYRTLIKDLRVIVDQGLNDRQQNYNLATTYTNWEVGRRLVLEEQDGKPRAGYGKQLLETIAKELRQSYGRGFSLSTLHYMRQFHQLYHKEDLQDELAWSHYVILLKISDIKLRKKFERLVIKNEWNARELGYQLRKHLDENTADIEEELIRPSGELGLIQVKHISENGQVKRFLDLGFNIWVESEDNELNDFSHKQLVTAERKKSKLQVKPWSGSRKSMWFYQATLDRVVDGDTIVAYIECSMGIRTHQILRLHSVNVAPLSDPAGIKARDFIEDILNKSTFLLVKTRHKDKYARYIADILVGFSGQSVEEVKINGLDLNQELLDRGYAVKAG